MNAPSWSRDYFKWALYIRPLSGVEVMVAAFVFEHHARKCGVCFKESSPIVKWIGDGNPPNLDGGFPEMAW